MDTLARFRLEAAKTRPRRLCNTTLRISHWLDWHSALATTSDAERYVIASMPCAIADPLPTRSAESPVEKTLRLATKQYRSVGYPCCNVHVPSLASHDLASRSVRVAKRSCGLRFS